MKEDLINTIGKLSGLLSIGSVNESEIEKAEAELGVKLAEDYKAYTRYFGAISCDGMEWSGVVNAKRLSVVDRTNSYRELYPSFPTNMYIVEELGIDGAVVLQDSTGKIYYYYPYCNDVEFVSDNLCAYLRLKKDSVKLEIRVFSPIDKENILKRIIYQNIVPSDYLENATKVIENSILDLPDGEYCFQVYREDDLEQDIMLGFIWKNKKFEKWIN